MPPCSCLGKQGNDQFCPCVMKQLGIESSNRWTTEKEPELKVVLGEIFNWSKEDERNRVE